MKNYEKLISDAEGNAENAISKVLKIGQELLDLAEYSKDYEPTYTTDGLTFVSKHSSDEFALSELSTYIVLEDAIKKSKGESEETK
jgi:hypothetical protein